MLLEASHAERKVMWNGREMLLKPGQFITGRRKMAVDSQLHESKIERILKCFEIEQQIEQQKSNTSRLISILNYKKYQDLEQHFEQQMNNKRTTSEQRVNTKQELKELKNNTRGRQPAKRVCRFVEFINVTFSRNFKPISKVVSAFEARLKQYDDKTLFDVVNNIKASTYHAETNFKYATPEFILRETTIEKYKDGPIINIAKFSSHESEPKKGQKYDPESDYLAEFR